MHVVLHQASPLLPSTRSSMQNSTPEQLPHPPHQFPHLPQSTLHGAVQGWHMQCLEVR